MTSNDLLLLYLNDIKYNDNYILCANKDTVINNLINYFTHISNYNYFNEDVVINVVFYGLEYATGVLFQNSGNMILEYYHVIMEYIFTSNEYKDKWYYKQYILYNFISVIIFNNINDINNILYLLKKYNYIGYNYIYNHLLYNNYKDMIKTHIHNKHLFLDGNNNENKILEFRNKYFIYDLFMDSNIYYNLY